ncbi:Uncharacterised protein [Candidatus Bartonella washoeensis]|uniref:Uncharacterized protein n=1 Tax=Candidatus Bartonella washoeensis Sb944nv TaxID=1094563 RepID=J0QFL7_9HYPH|nr:hypothetical protein MCQ_00332 [Bartonella washoeensis Sb944nv]SPU26128.1 Uncharacterised protein [Bartonella washoeensis]
MRVTSIILIFIGLMGIMNPEIFIAEGTGGKALGFYCDFFSGGNKDVFNNR